ncbi:putative extracelular serine carboxypeptidase [Aspergillus saccharolyticus JOP 1030-1]|uniref:Extracelular serine carboxypeptidase n=1 Tax=Aspergillus saccharolyticus JOP 1030-1 TaxID=1450539 RepID=A0A318ZGG5_9EURO|nr:hypothetical protein BP01DRAFT_344361 [Aspergillus saccharolyticus JOP 1030-1]PYH43673.1 hypothetical protein BP01DRAFT_344361 [Aspergillus saccharolyticus JOP 1030-1]
MYSLLLLLLYATTTTTALTLSTLRHLNHHVDQEYTPSLAEQQFPIYNLTTPLNHFPDSPRYPATNQTFPLRYIVDATYYQPGGPVFVIAGGETSALNRLPFLSQGIVHELARIYHGVGLIVEHRYYGTSYPEDIPQEEAGRRKTVLHLKYLTTEQALADYAYLATQLPPILSSLVSCNLTAETPADLSPQRTPWIAYGGSYAGAFVAFLRKSYPTRYWAAIASSGVTAAVTDYWQYYEPIRLHAPGACVAVQQALVAFVDRVLRGHPQHPTGDSASERLKQLFLPKWGNANALDDETFVAGLSEPLGLFQERNWDPRVGDLGFRWYCGNLTAEKVLDEALEEDIGTVVRELVRGVGTAAAAAAADDNDEQEEEALVREVVNWVGVVRRLGVFESASASASADAASASAEDKLLPRTASTSWNYQVCTEWGYFTPGSTVPPHIKPLVSRRLTPNFWIEMCNATYGIDTPPDTDRINQYGGFGFSYPRVAQIGGRADPWREASPFATGLPVRNSTAEEPRILVEVPATEVYDGMEGAVHHWDQNGVFGVEEFWEGKKVVPPKGVREAQGEVIAFVGGWLGEWQKQKDEEDVAMQEIQSPAHQIRLTLT